jgi:phosphoribosyl 1,2-cyclic phosphodiesterase
LGSYSGVPFFDPAFLPETELNIYAPRNVQHSQEEALAGQMQAPYFPVEFHDLRSHIRYTELEEASFRIGNVLITTQYLNHTAPTIAYRLSNNGVTVVYVTDHEPFRHPTTQIFQHPGDQRHIEFLKGADLIIHDAQYTQDEYRHKAGWGHSSIEYATDVALAAGVAHLALFHHDPNHDDATLQHLEKAACTHVAALGGGLELFAAAQGLALVVRHMDHQGYNRLRFCRALAVVNCQGTWAFAAFRSCAQAAMARRPVAWAPKRGAWPGVETTAHAIAALLSPRPGLGVSCTSSFRTMRQASAGRKGV